MVMRRSFGVASAAGVAAALVGVAAACAQGRGPRLPDGEPSIRGTITAVAASRAPRTGSVLIEERPGEAAGSAKARVTVAEDTRILVRAEDGTLRDAGFGDLVEGRRAEAWFDGPVLESYPVQARARTIVVSAAGRR
jgi:hypothetical protein